MVEAVHDQREAVRLQFRSHHLDTTHYSTQPSKVAAYRVLEVIEQLRHLRVVRQLVQLLLDNHITAGKGIIKMHLAATVVIASQHHAHNVISAKRHFTTQHNRQQVANTHIDELDEEVGHHRRGGAFICGREAQPELALQLRHAKLGVGHKENQRNVVVAHSNWAVDALAGHTCTRIVETV